MRKKISVDDVRLGMFLDELCGNWIDHPFWKSSFLLNAPKELATLKNSGIREVWIDTAKGLDVSQQTTATSESDSAQQVEQQLQAASKLTTPPPRASMEEELERARHLQAKASQAVQSMFQEARMGKALKMGEVTSLVDEISQSITRNPEAFLSLARLKTKDNYTYMHSVAVCALMIALGRQLEIDEALLQPLGMAGLLHDIGKMMIPDDVLNKPGKLTDEEFELMKSHPREGWEMLKHSAGIADITLDVCLHHHEKTDGTGYPDRLSGDALTLYARMGAVCDVYDAITSDRCYKAGWSPAEAIRKMSEWQAGHFDKAVFHAFVKTIGIHPSGTLVRLKSGRLAVVVQQAGTSLLTPLVKVFFSINANTHLAPKLVDLSKSQDAIEGIEDPAKWGFNINQILGIAS